MPDPSAPPGALGVRRRRPGELAVRVLLLGCALVSIATTIGILVALVRPAVDFFGEVELGSYLTGRDWAPLFSPPSFGVLPILGGTLVITGLASLVALPMGLGAAVYLSEYAGRRARNILKPSLEVLAGIPTVVYGFFALNFVTPLLQGGVPFDLPRFNALSAGLVMGIMILPTVASLSEDAMAAVPSGLREASYGLGAGRMQTAVRVVVPAALSGIAAAFVLGVSRAIGETMIVLIAAGGTPTLTLDPTEQMQTMTAFIAAAGLGDLSSGSIGYQTIFAVGASLFLITFVMNMASIRLVRRFRQVYD